MVGVASIIILQPPVSLVDMSDSEEEQEEEEEQWRKGKVCH